MIVIISGKITMDWWENQTYNTSLSAILLVLALTFNYNLN